MKPPGQFPGEFRAFSKDGQRLIATSIDEDTSRVYNLSGDLLAEYSGSTFDIWQWRHLFSRSLGFSPDGQHIMTLSNDGYVRLWRQDNGLDDLLVRGCTWLEDYFRANPGKQEELGICLTRP